MGSMFFLASVPTQVDVSPMSGEVTDIVFLSPATALVANHAQDRKLFLPTLVHLRRLARHPSTRVALAAAAIHASPEPMESTEDGSLVTPERLW